MATQYIPCHSLWDAARCREQVPQGADLDVEDCSPVIIRPAQQPLQPPPVNCGRQLLCNGHALLQEYLPLASIFLREWPAYDRDPRTSGTMSNLRSPMLQEPHGSLLHCLTSTAARSAAASMSPSIPCRLSACAIRSLTLLISCISSCALSGSSHRSSLEDSFSSLANSACEEPRSANYNTGCCHGQLFSTINGIVVAASIP